MGAEAMNVDTVMQVIGWASILIGLLVTIKQTAKSSQADQVKLENRLTKIESTLDNINDSLVRGDLIAKVNDLDTRLATIEERGCGYAHECLERIGKENLK